MSTDTSTPPGWRKLIGRDAGYVMAFVFYLMLTKQQDACAKCEEGRLEDAKQNAASMAKLTVSLANWGYSASDLRSLYVSDSVLRWKAAQYDSTSTLDSK